MINRAVGALPAFVLSLMISVPAFAKVSPERPHPIQRGVQQHHTTVSPATRGSGLASRLDTGHGRPVRLVPRTRPAGDGPSIRTAVLSSAHSGMRGTLIDDGTLWREQGSRASWQQTGTASWYGGKQWQGQKTSSGARYDENALTAAHATLPLGTKVRVVRHDGNSSVIVTINDRPGTRTRIIDLSREAAKTLGILDAGVAMVTLQPL